MADYSFHDCGSVWLVFPQTDDLRQDLSNCIGSERTWWNGALVVEPRYIADLAAGLQQEGFTVEQIA